MIYLFSSALGDIIYDWNGSHCQHLWLQQSATQQHLSKHTDPVSVWLTAYFNAESSPLPPLSAANTAFQQRLRTTLLDIPPGAVCSYGDLAKLLHSSPRGIGQALKANRLPLLIPCHRIVASTGLGGFNCGQTWKTNLLKFEADHLNSGTTKQPALERCMAGV
ncbi:MAG: methylated-DNA--[protein]-cysteine S-methyltransferase [Mariprofundus sp.]|nr:methylated-DNA--[protein]-cysteine S-methyltransferase [Mariprofundus sp.]